jgi:hypothetical protein
LAFFAIFMAFNTAQVRRRRCTALPFARSDTARFRAGAFDHLCGRSWPRKRLLCDAVHILLPRMHSDPFCGRQNRAQDCHDRRLAAVCPIWPGNTAAGMYLRIQFWP